MRKRGGQISIFIIIALVVLVSAGAWLYVVDTSRQDVVFVPEEVRPVHDYTVSCLQGAVGDAFTTISITGGYTDVPSWIRANPLSYARIAPIDELISPYWWYQGVNQIPSLEFIQEQMQGAIKLSFEECVANYTDLYPVFSVSINESPQVTVIFGDETTRTEVRMPITINFPQDNTQRFLNEFFYDKPVRFKAMHEFATNIVEQEKEEFFIERKAIDLLTLDPENLPVTEMELSCTPKVWRTEEAHDRWMELISQNIAYVKIAETPFSDQTYVNNPFGQDTYEESYFNANYVWNLEKKPPKNVKAAFTVDPTWKTVFGVRPSENGLMRASPIGGADILENLCVNLYHFTYDLQFPVRVTLVDVDEGSEPYAFSFFFQALIDHNQPSDVNRGIQLFDTVNRLSSVEFCEDAELETTFYTVDNVTGDQIRDVHLEFACGRFSCELGETDWLTFGAAAGITTQLPRCVHAVVRASKEGYQTSERFIQSDTDGESHILFLNPIVDIESYDFVVHPASNLNEQRVLSSSKRASIRLTAQEQSFQSLGVYPPIDEVPLQLLAAPVTYDVSIRLIEDNQIIGGFEDEWTVDPLELANANHITFHVIEDRDAGLGTELLTTLHTLSQEIPTPRLKTT